MTAEEAQQTPQHSSEEPEKQAERAGHAAHASESHAKARSRRGLRIALIVVGVILVIALVAVAAVGHFLNSGKDDLLESSEQTVFRKAFRHNGTDYVLNKNLINVALIGTDRGTDSTFVNSNGSADAIMVLVYDTETSKFTLINVPRNLRTNIYFRLSDGEEDSTELFIASAYAYGHSDAEGAEFVCKSLANLMLGLQVEDYVTMLEACIAPLTEAMGGVTLTALEEVRGGIHAGETYTLTGNQALWYVQYRDTGDLNSQATRIERQKQFIRAFLDQSIAAIKKDPSILGKFYDIVTDPQYMTTNMQLNELAYLASAVIQNGVSDIEMLTVPYDSEYDPVGRLTSYYPRNDELTDLIVDVYYTPAA